MNVKNIFKTTPIFTKSGSASQETPYDEINTNYNRNHKHNRNRTRKLSFRGLATKRTTHMRQCSRYEFKTRLFMSTLGKFDESFCIQTHHNARITSSKNNKRDKTPPADENKILGENPSNKDGKNDDSYDQFLIPASASAFNDVKEYFEASYTHKDHMVAKAILTKLMGKLYEYDNEQYYAFATILASGLSENGKNVSFEVGDDDCSGLVQKEEEVEIARMRFMLLMDIIFKLISVKRFLVDQDFSNIFRLVHCETKGQKRKWSFLYVLFSFLLQSCLAIFCVKEVLNDNPESNDYYGYGSHHKVGMYTLASLGSIFGFIAQISEFRSAVRVYSFYGKFGFLQMVDFSVNVIIPMIIICVGFWLVSSQDNFVDAVIMTTALLFIPEIDDQLPGLLGFNQEAIIETYLVREAKLAYNEFQKMDDEAVKLMIRDLRSQDGDRASAGMEFGDYFITPPDISEDDADRLQLFGVDCDSSNGHEIYPTNFICQNTLLKSVEWRYCPSDDGESSEVSWLRLVKFNGEVIEKQYGKRSASVSFSSQEALSSPYDENVHRLQGAFVITGFDMGISSISTLRLCGCQNVCDFLNAITYYSLWEFSRDASESLLQNKKIKCLLDHEKSVELSPKEGDYRSMV